MMKRLWLLAIPFGMIAAPALASVTQYTSAAVFDAANPGATNRDLNGNPEMFYGSPGAFSDAGVQIGSNDNLFTRDDNAYGTGGYISAQGKSPTTVIFDFPRAVDSFGFDYYSSSPFTLTENGNVTPFGAVETFPSLDFAGISDTTPFSKVTLNVSGFGIDFDNLKIGPVASLPEPSTWFMMILGFGFIGWAIRHHLDGAASLAS